MRQSKKRIILICLIAIIFLVLISYYFGLIKKTCSTEQCFEDAASVCQPVKYFNVINNNIYEYKISRSLGENCKIKISLGKSSIGTDFETKERLEGKSMVCLIPKTELYSVNLNEINNLLRYCTGSLKEGIYEVIIKNMYSVIISNLGEILGEVQTSLIKKI